VTDRVAYKGTVAIAEHEFSGVARDCDARARIAADSAIYITIRETRIDTRPIRCARDRRVCLCTSRYDQRDAEHPPHTITVAPHETDR
jgi:hypothetical protein